MPGMSFWSGVRRFFGMGSSSESAPSKPEDHFALAMMEVVRAIPGVTSVRRSDTDFALELTTAQGNQTFFLGNMFAETREVSPDERAERVRRFVSALVAPESDLGWEQAIERLVPLLRASTIFTGVTGGAEGPVPIARPFAPFLIETVGIDSDASFQIVTSGDVERWEVSIEQVFAAAHGVAASAFQDEDVAPYDPSAPYPIWCVARDDSYESSRLLLPGWLASFEGRVKGRPVAIVPDRSKLIVGGDGDEACLKRLVETARREHQASHRSISPALYTVGPAGNVVPLTLPPNHPLAKEVTLGHLQLALAEYGAQQKPLQDKVGGDTFVATFKGVERPDGTLTSLSTWSENVATLLPKTEEIVFVLGPGSNAPVVFGVPWTVVERIAGDHLVREPDLDPPRWRTRWPDADTVAKLRAAATR
jgi:hypothetical protein